MHGLVSANLDSSRRWAVLAIVVAAQFMFGVDAFIVIVALPTIPVELDASAAQVEAVIAIYLIAYATLVVTGGRLGDIYGTRSMFLAGACLRAVGAGLRRRLATQRSAGAAARHAGADRRLRDPGCQSRGAGAGGCIG